MIVLPATFKPTHATDGLPGYPAIDRFGDPGERFRLDVTGKVRRLSGKPCSQGGRPGGAYGQSLYILADNGDDHYLTHSDRIFVKVGQTITPTTDLGTICDAKVSGRPGTSHIHHGVKKAKNPLPEPSERLYDLFGSKGNPIARRQTAAKITKNIARWVKTHGIVTIRHADG